MTVKKKATKAPTKKAVKASENVPENKPKNKPKNTPENENPSNENEETPKRKKRFIREGTTTAYAKRIYDAVRTGKIKMGEMEDKSVENVMSAEHWKSEPLEGTGAIIEFTRTMKLTDREDGKEHRSQNTITIRHGERKQSIRGEWARKIYIALTKMSRNKTVDMTPDDINFCDNALNGL